MGEVDSTGQALVFISIATYKRDEQLTALLDALRLQIPRVTNEIQVLIVDNHPEGQAVKSVGPNFPEFSWLHEPRPGIAAARNRGLCEISSRVSPDDCHAVIFIDDDEEPDSNWLTNLVSAWESWDADAVTGPVITRIPLTAPSWIVRGGFLERPTFREGPYSFLPATNNTIVSGHHFMGERGLRFDEEFSVSGGSDTELFNRLRKRGARFYWQPSARVYEEAPVERLRFGWIWRRGVRSGNVLARIQLQERSTPIVAISGMLRLVFGIGVTLKSIVLGRGVRHEDFIYVMRGVGFFGAITGRLQMEYSRVIES